MKNGLYKWLKIGGLLSFLPFVLVAGPLAGFFAAPSELHLLLHLVVLAFFGSAIEEMLSSKWFALTYVAGALVGNLAAGVVIFGFEANAAGGAGSGIMALVGTLVAIRPNNWVVAEFFPLPAFVAAAFFIIAKFLLAQSLDVVPLFVGIAFGYVVKESQEMTQTAGPRPPYGPMRR